MAISNRAAHEPTQLCDDVPKCFPLLLGNFSILLELLCIDVCFATVSSPLGDKWVGITLYAFDINE